MREWGRRCALSCMDQLQLPLVEPGASPPEFLTIAEAARWVRCCERTIRRAIDSGALRAGKVSGERFTRGAWRIRAVDLERWMFGDAA